MSSSNCCFLTCIQVSQEVGQVVWYSHLFQDFPQFIVIHTVEGFGIVIDSAYIDTYSVLEILIECCKRKMYNAWLISNANLLVYLDFDRIIYLTFNIW